MATEITTNVQLWNFAFLPKFPELLKNLAAMVQKEDWSYSILGISDNERGITKDIKMLDNYISRNFGKIYQDSQREGGNKYLYQDAHTACFNTGLITDLGEMTYGYFEKNTMADKQKWVLKAFCGESDLRLSHIEDLPSRAHYFDNAKELLYDETLQIRPNVNHILGETENVERLPEKLKSEENKILLKNAFAGAIKHAELLVATNYTLAVPQYREGKIQLLIPLSITQEEPELALTLEKNDEGTVYIARTCLTLEMAYNNARQLMKPVQAWITN